MCCGSSEQEEDKARQEEHVPNEVVGRAVVLFLVLMMDKGHAAAGCF